MKLRSHYPSDLRLLIIGGLQGEKLGADAQGNVEPARLEALCETAGEAPAAALPVLRW